MDHGVSLVSSEIQFKLSKLKAILIVTRNIDFQLILHLLFLNEHPLKCCFLVFSQELAEISEF